MFVHVINWHAVVFVLYHCHMLCLLARSFAYLQKVPDSHLRSTRLVWNLLNLGVYQY